MRLTICTRRINLNHSNAMKQIKFKHLALAAVAVFTLGSCKEEITEEAIKEAKEAALAIMQQAKDESNAIISASKAKAMEIMDKSERWSNDMRKNASAYVENVIKDTDETLTRSVNDIRTLRQSLRDALSASGESRPELD